MKLLFVYDTRVYENQGSYYTTAMTQEVIDRYRGICGSLSWCTFIIPNNDETFCRRINKIRNASVSMIPLPKTNSLTGLLRGQRDNDRVLEDAIRAHDMILIRLPSRTGARAIRLAEQHHKPYLVELVSCIWDELWNHGLKGKLQAPASWLMVRRIMKDVPMAMYVTDHFLQNRYPCDGERIGCSDVSLPERDPQMLARRMARIQQVGQRTQPLKLGTLAAVDVRCKGQQDVIAAIGRLKRQGLRVEYELAGGGDPNYLIRAAKKWGVQDQVRFYGVIPHEQVFSWLENLDLYIQPGKQAGLPRAVAEAMHCACPVMGAGTGGVPELIAPQMVFRAGNVGQICRMIKRADRQLLQTHAIYNYKKAAEYEQEILDEKRQAFYERFLRMAGDRRGEAGPISGKPAVRKLPVRKYIVSKPIVSRYAVSNMRRGERAGSEPA